MKTCKLVTVIHSLFFSVCPKWSKLSKNHKEKKSVILLVVCSSALRTLELIKLTNAFKGDTKIMKLFAKHLKIKDQIKWLENNVIHLGVGTPERIKALIEQDGLSLQSLKYLVLDWNWRDKKQRRMVDIPEVMRSFAFLYCAPYSSFHALLTHQSRPTWQFNLCIGHTHCHCLRYSERTGTGSHLVLVPNAAYNLNPRLKHTSYGIFRRKLIRDSWRNMAEKYVMCPDPSRAIRLLSALGGAAVGASVSRSLGVVQLVKKSMVELLESGLIAACRDGSVKIGLF
ncbi:unnamed protein product [Ranitomeya imitator]|uniref:Protein CMSS1 n=1 Tax=Ranitomeya imitator TaxID=111125 RepID=A0ABN9MCE0_9NEOB|nr:unnamed protein product [Ranitomeya imitator]